MTLKQAIKRLEQAHVRIAKERDKLHKIMYEVDALLCDTEEAEECISEAVDTLQYAVDALSKTQ
jgi:hypothetical protein